LRKAKDEAPGGCCSDGLSSSAGKLSWRAVLKEGVTCAVSPSSLRVFERDDDVSGVFKTTKV